MNYKLLLSFAKNIGKQISYNSKKFCAYRFRCNAYSSHFLSQRTFYQIFKFHLNDRCLAYSTDSLLAIIQRVPFGQTSSLEFENGQQRPSNWLRSVGENFLFSRCHALGKFGETQLGMKKKIHFTSTGHCLSFRIINGNLFVVVRKTSALSISF